MVSPQLHRVWSGSTRETPPDPSANPFLQDRREILNRDTFLLHRIAIAQRHCLAQRRISFAARLEIDCHTERRADFVLATVSPANRAALIVKHSHVRPQKRYNLLRFRYKWLLVF